jgi:hypothetical protein
VELDGYSARFLAAVLEAFPEFGSSVVSGAEPGCFSITVAAPSGAELRVETWSEESITIGFAEHHVHFGGWFDSVEERDFADAVEYLCGVTGGDYEVLVWELDGAFAGSVTRARGEGPGEPPVPGATARIVAWGA